MGEILTIVSLVINALFGVGFGVEIYRRRNQTRDRKEGRQEEVSKEEIIDRRLFANELMERVRELERIERNLMAEKFDNAKEVGQMRNTIQLLVMENQGYRKRLGIPAED